MPDENLPSTWSRRWQVCPPIAHELKSAYRDRWVRFHSLPDSKRYPENEAEYEIALDRYNTVLDELFAGDDVYVITPDWSESPQPGLRPSYRARQHPEAVHWMSVDTEGTLHTHLYRSRLAWKRGCIDELLRAVADDALSGVLVADVELRRIHHPYDGGADVILPTSAERDALRTRHSEWLSARPDGF